VRSALQFDVPTRPKNKRKQVFPEKSVAKLRHVHPAKREELQL
jgi:hypothetical protein